MTTEEAAISEMTKEILIPQVDNFTYSKRTPWGGHLIAKFKEHLGVKTTDIVGESWEISGHPSFPNLFDLEYEGKTIKVPISSLEKKGLYSKKKEIPFLVKLLNSGSWQDQIEQLSPALKNYTNYHELHLLISRLKKESGQLQELDTIHQKMLEKNLSVQVHPRKGDSDKPSKTEGWIILAAEKGAGIYLGLKEEITKEQFENAILKGEDVSDYLNFVEVFPGDVYLIPAGTLHAIGAGILLVEPQETSETTFRAYDWNRLYDGRPRQLHISETIASTNWEAERGQALVKKLKKEPSIIQQATKKQAEVESILKAKEFQCHRITLKENIFETDTNKTGIQGYIIIEGSVEVLGKTLQKGQSFIAPAALGKFQIKGLSQAAILIETYCY